MVQEFGGLREEGLDEVLGKCGVEVEVFEGDVAGDEGEDELFDLSAQFSCCCAHLLAVHKWVKGS